MGARKTKFYHEKVIHEQTIVLQSWPNDPKEEGTLSPNLHRWPFQFLLANHLIETIEDDQAKVYYYVTATIHKVGMGVTKPRTHRDILLLRTPSSWSDSALMNSSLPTTSIISERKLDVCDAHICIEKSAASSGTHFPIVLSISANEKNVYIESISVILTEKRSYRLPEFQARRFEHYDYKVSLADLESLEDSTLIETQGLLPRLTVKEMRRLLGVKNAHLPLDGGPFRHRLIFSLPNCVNLNHSTTFSEIDISHELKIRIELSSDKNKLEKDFSRSTVRLDTPITILDCRLKEDYTSLPTYKEALLTDGSTDEHDKAGSPTNCFFACPCYLAFKKKTQCNRKDWMRNREQHRIEAQANSLENTPPPSYDSIDPK
jgi:hypothetical protein